MKPTIIFFILLLGVGFTACKTDTETNSPQNEQILPLPGDVNSNLPVKEYEEDVEVLFDDQNVVQKTNLEDSLLRVIKICNPNETDLKNYKFPACDSKFFKILPIQTKSSIRDGFLVLCKSGVAGFPMRRILVYVKENQEYILVNTFLADVIGLEKSQTSQYKDLILQFMDEDENRFECRYVWKEGRYKYEKVMKINRSKIKAQYLDSMKIVIADEIKRMKLSY